MLIPLLVALGIGAAIALQATAVSSITGSVHPLTVSLALLASGILVAAVWATVRHEWPDTLAVAGHWWWLPLGVVGWAIVAALGWTAGRLGVAAALALVVGSQLTAALVIDLARGDASDGAASLAWPSSCAVWSCWLLPPRARRQPEPAAPCPRAPVWSIRRPQRTSARARRAGTSPPAHMASMLQWWSRSLNEC